MIVGPEWPASAALRTGPSALGPSKQRDLVRAAAVGRWEGRFVGRVQNNRSSYPKRVSRHSRSHIPESTYRPEPVAQIISPERPFLTGVANRAGRGGRSATRPTRRLSSLKWADSQLRGEMPHEVSFTAFSELIANRA